MNDMAALLGRSILASPVCSSQLAWLIIDVLVFLALHGSLV